MATVSELVAPQTNPANHVDGRNLRGQNTRERIIQSARDLISTAGFHRSSLEDVARRAGVTRATVYQHFGSKRGLLEAVLASSAPPAHGSTRERESVALAHPGPALRSLIAAQVRTWAANAPMLHRVHTLAAVDPGGGGSPEADTPRRVELAIIVIGLAERGQLRPGCTRREAFEALWMVTGFASFEHLHLRSRLDLGEVENTLLALAGGIVDWDATLGEVGGSPV
jgi:AcrR family transcriptional regulator